MPFTDASGIVCLTLEGIWDEPIQIQFQDTVVYGKTPNVEGMIRIQYYIIVEFAQNFLPQPTNIVQKHRYQKHVLGHGGGFRHYVFPVADGQSPGEVALIEGGKPLSGRWNNFEDAVDECQDLRTAAAVMEL